MSLFERAMLFLNDPVNWTKPNGILQLLGEHLTIAGLSLLFGMLIALPVGIWLGHSGRGGGFAVGLSNVSRAVPTLAILTILAVTPIGFTIWAPVIALTIFAVPPILANTYVGFREVDRDVIEAARAMGMDTPDLIRKAELPLAMPLIMTGIRTAGVQVVATATLAALLAGGTLGRLIRSGFGTQDYGVVLAGALLVAILAILTEVVLGTLGWLITPGQKRIPFAGWFNRGGKAPVEEAVAKLPVGEVARPVV